MDNKSETWKEIEWVKNEIEAYKLMITALKMLFTNSFGQTYHVRYARAIAEHEIILDGRGRVLSALESPTTTLSFDEHVEEMERILNEPVDRDAVDARGIQLLQEELDNREMLEAGREL